MGNPTVLGELVGIAVEPTEVDGVNNEGLLIAVLRELSRDELDGVSGDQINAVVCGGQHDFPPFFD